MNQQPEHPKLTENDGQRTTTREGEGERERKRHSRNNRPQMPQISMHTQPKRTVGKRVPVRGRGEEPEKNVIKKCTHTHIHIYTRRYESTYSAVGLFVRQKAGMIKRPVK